MSMSGMFVALKAVLTVDAPLLAVVPVNNIRPAEDPTEPEAGNLLYYGWASGSWDVKRNRGEGVIRIAAGAVDNNVVAGSILDLVRAALSARKLSYTGGPVRAHLWQEESAFTDAGTTDSARFLAATNYRVRWIAN